MSESSIHPQRNVSRRQFVGGSLAATAAGSLLGALHSQADGAPAEAPPAAPPVTRKVKIGLIGCGGRGSWLGGLFKQHGGYDIHATADYFQA